MKNNELGNITFVNAANGAQVDGVMGKNLALGNIATGNDVNAVQVDGVMGQNVHLANIVIGNGAGANTTSNGNVTVHSITIQPGSTITITEQGSITGPTDLIFGNNTNNTMHIEEGAVLTHCTIAMVGDAFNITQLNDGEI